MQWKCSECGIKKSRLVKEQEGKGLLSNLGIKTPLIKIPLLNVLSWMQFHWVYKLNEIVDKYLVAGDTFMPEMHLKQPGFTYSACGSFSKNKERIEKLMQTGNTDFIYRNELDEVGFQHDMASRKSNDLAKRTQSDKVSKDQALKSARDPKSYRFQRGLA